MPLKKSRSDVQRYAKSIFQINTICYERYPLLSVSADHNSLYACMSYNMTACQFVKSKRKFQ